MTGSRSYTALESLARLRTMRALIPTEDYQRFERLIGEVEHSIADTETIAADLARVIAITLTEQPLRPSVPLELTDVAAAALRSVDALLRSRGVAVQLDAASPAIFATGDRERLVQLIALALSIGATASRAPHQVHLRYGLFEGSAFFEITPYASHDPRVTIVEALARSQNAQLDATNAALTMRLPAAMGAASA